MLNPYFLGKTGFTECVMINLYFAYLSANHNFLKAKSGAARCNPQATSSTIRLC